MGGARVGKGWPKDYLARMPAYVRPTKQIGLRLAPELLAQIEAVAKAEDRSVSYVIKRILVEEMARRASAKKTKR